MDWALRNRGFVVKCGCNARHPSGWGADYQQSSAQNVKFFLSGPLFYTWAKGLIFQKTTMLKDTSKNVGLENRIMREEKRFHHGINCYTALPGY
jgi:hypothetical protein